ncbi:radical SAM/SPASM domain-containing protein [Bradyrhizobium macuxiense]|nr:radical SAM/SPASM domain-containing protein [Bradyrhizobium macuxiense]
MTDTHGAESPDTDDHTGASFGIVDLDRKVSWRHDRAELDILRRAAAYPTASQMLIENYGATSVVSLYSLNWLQAPDALCRDYNLISGEIEISSHCNWACACCPVSAEPKGRNTMSLDLFEETIHKLAEHAGIDYVTFHFFNEPTLDRFFDERVSILRRHHLKLALYTNGSALTEGKLRQLIESETLYHLIFNIPSPDADEFRSLTNSRTFPQTIRNLEIAIELKAFPIDIVVNGIEPRLSVNTRALKARYGRDGVRVGATTLSDRAGVLKGEFDQHVFVDGALRGCNWPVNHFYVAWNGDVFICCNDYHQKETYGNVRDGTIHEIMSSDAAVHLRRRVFGIEAAPKDFICRRCHDQALHFPFKQFQPIATHSSEKL